MMDGGASPDMWEAPLQRALERAKADTSDYDLNEVTLPPNRKLRAAAVLVGVTEAGGVLLTRRSAALKHHPGQIAFPGGKVEMGEDAVAAAIREACEEVAMPPGAARVLGTLPAHETVTGFTVTPVLARLSRFDIHPEPGEVAEAFEVPLAHLADLGAYVVRSRRWRGSDRRYYAIPWGPHYIWGATARMLRALAEGMA